MQQAITRRLNIDEGIRRMRKDLRMRVLIMTLPKPELTISRNVFRALTRAIVYQQLSGKAAGTIFTRFIALYPRKAFPKPTDVLKTSDSKLRSAGLSNQKVSYVQDLAKKFEDKTIDPKYFHSMTDEEISEHLIRVKGIGEWSAHMFLIFFLHRPNVLPVGDLGIQKGAQIFFKLRMLPKPLRLRKLAKPYEGDHTLFSLYLWRLADVAKNKS